ncbi:hypothetical protein [Halococcus salifodinae]|uniref:hypothetical protein n=1 Tax=Halococcus salifodinae TaxID=36738 RepID=UPI003F845703
MTGERFSVIHVRGECLIARTLVPGSLPGLTVLVVGMVFVAPSLQPPRTRRATSAPVSSSRFTRRGGSRRSFKSTEALVIDMARGDQTIDRTPEKPPRGEGGTGDEPGSVWLDRILTRLVLGKVAPSEESDDSTPDGAIDRDPEKPPPEESGVWNKRGSRTVDRIVEWLVPT